MIDVCEAALAWREAERGVDVQRIMHTQIALYVALDRLEDDDARE